MKILIGSLLLICNASLSFAATKGFFNNPNQVAIIIQGRDMDAPRLFDSLNVSQEQTPSGFKKNLTFTSLTNEKTLNITCYKSKNVENFGSCTVEFFRSQWTKIDSSSVQLAFDNQNSSSIRHFFSESDNEGLIYQSIDGRLLIRLDDNGTSVKLFSIVYK